MFAVAGTWKIDPAKQELQAQVLPQLVDNVAKNPGFLRGFWADDLDEPDQSVTFIVFATREQAESFRDAVVANAPAQAEAGIVRESLRIVEVQADA